MQRKLYVYCQNPLNGTWETVGRFGHDHLKKIGAFTYLDEYVSLSDAQSIDPVNLPISPGQQNSTPASRYGGLPDVLRDSAPDGWGQYLLCKFSDVGADASALELLLKSKNNDRWGALAIGASIRPPEWLLAPPEYPDLDLLIDEIAALEVGKPAVSPKLRKWLQEYSGGGVRPKATLRDSEGAFWLAKPRSLHDHAETPVTEFFCQNWASLIGLKVAKTELAKAPSGRHIALIQRFDRVDGIRQMCLSAASVMGYEYPGPVSTGTLGPSYPLLASKLKSIGTPVEDRKELFDRLVFNALCGNDDDHTRNHAVVFDGKHKTWRLSPAYDMVPTYEDRVRHLSMCTSLTDKTISRENFLSDFVHFGFESESSALNRIQEIVQKGQECFKEVSSVLSSQTKDLAADQLDFMSRLLDPGKTLKAS